MKTIILSFLFVAISTACSPQKNTEIPRITKLREIPTVVLPVQEYEVTIRRELIDPIEYTRFHGDMVKANYFVFKNDQAEWWNVKVGTTESIHKDPSKLTEKTDFRFKYKTRTDDFLKEDFYADLPKEDVDLARMLIGDGVQMQEIVWYIADSLEYKKDFFPGIMNNFDISFQDSYTFSSKYQKYVWSGYTTHNNKPCAIVKFESFFNPFINEKDGFVFSKGRSTYYGELWISLEDKQVEYSIMVEDVIMKDRGPNSEEYRLMDLQREIVFNKVK